MVVTGVQGRECFVEGMLQVFLSEEPLGCSWVPPENPRCNPPTKAGGPAISALIAVSTGRKSVHPLLCLQTLRVKRRGKQLPIYEEKWQEWATLSWKPSFWTVRNKYLLNDPISDILWLQHKTDTHMRVCEHVCMSTRIHTCTHTNQCMLVEMATYRADWNPLMVFQS